MVRTRRILVVSLLATLALLPALASARPAAPPSRASLRAQGASSGTDLTSRLWHGLRNLWGREGMTIDPNGARLSGAGTAGQLSAGPLAGGGAPIAPHS